MRGSSCVNGSVYMTIKLFWHVPVKKVMAEATHGHVTVHLLFDIALHWLLM